MGIVLFAVFVSLIEAQQADSSFDSLVASQCRARCLSLYPWAPESQEASPFQAYLAKRVSYQQFVFIFVLNYFLLRFLSFKRILVE